MDIYTFRHFSSGESCHQKIGYVYFSASKKRLIFVNICANFYNTQFTSPAPSAIL